MKLKITGQEIEVVDKYLLVTETENLYEIGFEFDDSWEGYAKTVVFKDATTIYSVLLTGETCPIPNEIIAESGNVQFGVFGTKVDGTKTLKKPTIWSEKLYVDVGCVTGDTPGEPTPDIYAQIVALAEAAAESAEDSAESAEASATSALNAQQAAEIAQATVSHTPYIDSTNYHWKRWNATTQAYEDTGVDARGLNNITTSTDTDLNGILKGNGSKVGVAVSGTDYVVPVEGKGLSTNDYDNTEKQKVADSYQVRHSHSNKELLDTYNQTNANITDAIGKKHEHANKSTLDGISGTDISNWNQVTYKYEKPESGIPKSDLASSVQTSLGKADTALQEHQSLSAYRTSSAQDVIDATKADASSVYTKSETDSAISNHHDNSKANVADLATVATSGSYDDLSNKPTIPTKTSDLTNDSGFIDNTYHDASKQNETDLSLNTTSKQIVGAINEVKGVADGKISKVANATANNVPQLNASGELTNGLGTTNAQGIPIVTSISSASTNAQVPSAKSVYDCVLASKNTIKTTLEAIAVVNSDYYLGTQSTVAIVLPSSASIGDTISVIFYSGSTATTLSISGNTIGTVVVPATNQRVEISMLYDGTYWAILSNTMSSV